MPQRYDQRTGLSLCMYSMSSLTYSCLLIRSLPHTHVWRPRTRIWSLRSRLESMQMQQVLIDYCYLLARTSQVHAKHHQVRWSSWLSHTEITLLQVFIDLLVVVSLPLLNFWTKDAHPIIMKNIAIRAYAAEASLRWRACGCKLVADQFLDIDDRLDHHPQDRAEWAGHCWHARFYRSVTHKALSTGLPHMIPFPSISNWNLAKSSPMTRAISFWKL